MILAENKHSRLVIASPKLNFSAGHFTIFSASERENLHGHNYRVKVELEVEVGEDGISFDYAIVKDKILALCNQLNLKTILPQHSPYLTVSENDGYFLVSYYNEKLYFLKRDIILLPIRNSTLEDLSAWFLQALLQDKRSLLLHKIKSVQIQVDNGTGQVAIVSTTI